MSRTPMFTNLYAYIYFRFNNGGSIFSIDLLLLLNVHMHCGISWVRVDI